MADIWDRHLTRSTSPRVCAQVPYGFTRELKTVLAARPEVLPLIVEYNPECPWGHYIEFEGTREQLIATGVASAAMFDGLSHGEMICGPDEFGCKFTVERYQPERFRIMRFLMDHPCYGDPADQPQNWPSSLREIEPRIRKFVEEVLGRIAAGCS